jgi:hypothetical protein
MRRACMILTCTLIIQGVLSSQAYAWWDEVEKMSGPGPFYGWDVEVRLFCLVETHQRDANGRITRTDTEKVAPTAIGAVVSACRVKKGSVRRMAVDLGARFLWAKDNPDFANGERVNLTTLEPSISFNLLSKHPDRDFVDFGFGAGAYWFSSTAFPSFNGAFLEPIRFEFHATTNMKQQHKWAAAVPRVRVGYLLFPAGFETASFLASPTIPPRISRDWVFNVALFFDLEGLFD